MNTDSLDGSVTVFSPGVGATVLHLPKVGFKGCYLGRDLPPLENHCLKGVGERVISADQMSVCLKNNQRGKYIF